jgi:hypothetical protein
MNGCSILFDTPGFKTHYMIDKPAMRFPTTLLLSTMLLCGGSATSLAAGGIPSFQKDLKPLFDAKCVRCHGDKVHKANLDLRTLDAVIAGGDSGAVIVPGNPDKSLLFEKVHKGEMPPAKKDRLSESEVEVLRRWIAEGVEAEAKNSSTSNTAVSQHDVLPIMLRRCNVCHGLHEKKAGLDLRTKAAMLRGGKSGPGFVPGKPAESLILKKINAGEMPPPALLVEACVKPVEKTETEILTRWIAAGAPEIEMAADVATKTPDPLVSDKDREFWAFRSPKSSPVPTVKNAVRIRNPIDNFVLKKLEDKGLNLSPEADQATLIRRAYFDLTGLPPDPEEVKAFLADKSPDAYEKMIDRLLASPRYGERWGRFWLDLAGYADSEGKREQDLPRPQAWRYRDYVIRAYNSDKPYDCFLQEQLAGDELADYEHAPEITPALYDNLVATGFLRMAPDATWANITGFIPDRIEVIADEMDVLGSVVMGLTMKCARCHNHKFDPIPQRDYYRLTAVFKGALDEYDWLKPDIRPGLGPVSQDTLGGRLLPYVSASERRAWESQVAKIKSDSDALRKTLDDKAAILTAKYVEERINKLPDVLREDVKIMLGVPGDKRDAVQRYLAEKFEKQLRIDRNTLKALDAGFKKESDETDARIRTLQSQRPAEPMIQAVWDRGEPSPTYIYRRGDPLNIGKLVGPGVPSVLTDGKTPLEVNPPWPGAKTTGRRLAFARWLTQPNHPLTARVEVNRIWKHHFGTGIVTSLGNFGKTGSPPTHPELLDFLATEFIRQGWSRKAIHRLMLTSATYRQSSAHNVEAEKLDPANALYSRMPLNRLDAESLYDSLLQVAGKLDENRFGPADPVQVRRDGLVTPSGTSKGWRRLIYVQQTRKQLATHLETFDFPQMNPNCIERRDSTVAPQALHLLNNAMIEQLAADFAKRIRRETGTDAGRQIASIYLIALSRMPTAEEKRVGLEALDKLADEWDKQLIAVGKPDRDAAEFKALTTYCHAILNSAAFLFVD